MPAYLPRRADASIREALRDTRVVTVSGARQVGKSTLVRRILRDHPDAIQRRLDVPAELAAAKADPVRFVRHHDLVSIDEVQRAPELALTIKAIVDEDDRPGQFLLTGSARLLGRRALPDALVGRMETIELWPFSQGELQRTKDDFIDRAFAKGPDLAMRASETREGYAERVARGGFPEATRRDEGRRSRFFSAYAEDLVDRDVVQLSEIQRRDDLRRLLRTAAGRVAQPLKIENIASEIRAPATTIERYVGLFEEVFLVKRIPAWGASSTGRAVHMPKLIFVDSGLCCNLNGRSVKRLVNDDVAFGSLLENFVLGELARQLGWSRERADLFHFRTRDGIAIDAVLEAADGRLIGIEVKAGETVRSDDFNPLRHLQRRVPKQFHLGVVLHTGKQTLPFGDNMVAAPIETLWR